MFAHCNDNEKNQIYIKRNNICYGNSIINFKNLFFFYINESNYSVSKVEFLIADVPVPKLIQ